jgi:hypothetical protein
MSKHTIFLVHGMGDFKAKWSDDLQEMIRTLYGRYPGLELMPFDEAFEFQEVLYNDKFDAIRDQWSRDATKVLDAIGAEAKQGKSSRDRKEAGSAVSGLMTFATGAGKNDFLRTHVLDVAMYRFLTPVRAQVRAAVFKQIMDVLKAKPKNEPVRWSVLGHSLGTAVVHDTIHAMYTDKAVPLPSNVTRPKVIAMIANVSRIVETDSDPYKSFTHPSLDPAGGACDYFVNARNEWDLFTVPKRFRPTDDWPDLDTRHAGRYVGVEVNAIADKNVHAVEHYLGNPKVHVALFRTLTFQRAISDDEAEAASRKYEESTPLGKFNSLIKQLKEIDLGENSEWEQVIAGFFDFAETIG